MNDEELKYEADIEWLQMIYIITLLALFSFLVLTLAGYGIEEPLPVTQEELPRVNNAPIFQNIEVIIYNSDLNVKETRNYQT